MLSARESRRGREIVESTGLTQAEVSKQKVLEISGLVSTPWHPNQLLMVPFGIVRESMDTVMFTAMFKHERSTTHIFCRF